MEKIFCAYDNLNPTIIKETGESVHACKLYGSSFCTNCNSRYDGDKIKKYMEDHPKEH